MIKNIIINNIDRCNAVALYKSLEILTINFISNQYAVNTENVNCAKDKIKENLQFCIINPKSI